MMIDTSVVDIKYCLHVKRNSKNNGICQNDCNVHHCSLFCFVFCVSLLGAHLGPMHSHGNKANM